MNKILIKERMFTIVFSCCTTCEQVLQTTMSEPTKAEIAQDPIAEALTAEAPVAEAPIALKRQITLSLRSKIRSLRTIAFWPFRRIAANVNLPLGTLFSIYAQSGSSNQIQTGSPSCLSSENERLLLADTTLSAENRSKSLHTIAEELDIHVHEQTLCRFFANSGDHCRITRVKPFLTPKQNIARLLFADT